MELQGEPGINACSHLTPIHIFIPLVYQFCLIWLSYDNRLDITVTILWQTNMTCRWDDLTRNLLIKSVGTYHTSLLQLAAPLHRLALTKLPPGYIDHTTHHGYIDQTATHLSYIDRPTNRPPWQYWPIQYLTESRWSLHSSLPYWSEQWDTEQPTLPADLHVFYTQSLSRVRLVILPVSCHLHFINKFL